MEVTPIMRNLYFLFGLTLNSARGVAVDTSETGFCDEIRANITDFNGICIRFKKLSMEDIGRWGDRGISSKNALKK